MGTGRACCLNVTIYLRNIEVVNTNFSIWYIDTLVTTRNSYSVSLFLWIFHERWQSVEQLLVWCTWYGVRTFFLYFLLFYSVADNYSWLFGNIVTIYSRRGINLQMNKYYLLFHNVRQVSSADDWDCLLIFDFELRILLLSQFQSSEK